MLNITEKRNLSEAFLGISAYIFQQLRKRLKRDQQIGIAKDFFLPRIRQFVDRSGKRGPALGRIRPIFFS
ncbi:hypothetical protein LEP1GSC163_1337 [Leptospira santarosai str. CBC379]|nr:hypothetical protein LEP1GSC163_1337 [Leptospira santarosai str. CBC379]ONF87339.1 hypothetical protein BWD13_06115 [Leptospira santarosai serovar Grippotyphosa]